MKQYTIKDIEEQLGISKIVALHALRIVMANDMFDTLSGEQDDSAAFGLTLKDRSILSSFARYLVLNGDLTSKQEVVLLKLMPKYAEQYMEYLQNNDDSEEEDGSEEEQPKTTPYRGDWGLDFLE